jgi:beta-1,4-mannosyl-glycoprotein beta-1,4-N-acetylglucosaminyltransferase
MKIFDCFTYYDEDLVLDIRLNTLNNYVDKFVIIEAGEDHQGNKKKKNFKIDNFKKFKNKIIYLFFDKFPNLKDSWQRENFQRNFISKALVRAKENDLIIISDVDEIPNLKNYNFVKSKKLFFVFEQKMLYYKINLLSETYPIWHGSKACRKKDLISPQWLRSQKIYKEYPIWKIDKIKFEHIINGGWHFSYLKNYDGIVKKLQSFAHTEYNKPKYTNLKNIKKLVKNHKDIFGRKIKYKKIEINSLYPEYILKNLDKFKDFIVT